MVFYKNHLKIVGIISTVLGGGSVYGFENTKVLPKGIRNLTLKMATTTIAGKTDALGNTDPLAKPLEKTLSFSSIVKGESGLKKTLLRGFLAAEHFDDDEELVQVHADMKANVVVQAPILSYGVSDKLTLALAVPYYNAAVGLEMGFVPSARADEFIRRLDAPENNLTASAREASEKLNNMGGELDRKLDKNGYQALRNWSRRGIGDVMVVAKYRLVDAESIKLASQSGMSFATGKIADPDVLNSIPFGKGAHQFFTGLIIDEPLPLNFVLNQYGKYTHSLPSRHELRLKTAEETIEVEKSQVRSQLGAQLDAGSSLMYEPSFGLVAGVGYAFQLKAKDRYDLDEYPDSRDKWQESTFQRAHFVESKLGYSGIEAFKRKQLPIPFTADLEYKKFISGVNTFTNDLVSMNVAVFF
jgi:hypothetical protein